MDYNAISCGVAGQVGTLPAGAKEKISEELSNLLRNGYRRFLIAVTGETTLLFAETVLSFRQQYTDIGIDLLLPFDGWMNEQPDSTRYKQITAQAESVNHSCEEEYEDSVEICNRQLIGFGRCMVIIGDDDAMRELIEETRDAEQEVWEILI